MILLQATVVGLLGYGIGVGSGGSFRLADRRAPSWPSTRPGSLLPITAGAIVLICILSSLLSVQKVVRLEPAIVFR